MRCFYVNCKLLVLFLFCVSFLLYLHQSKPQLVITRCQGSGRNYVLRLFVKPARIRNQSLRSVEEYFALICQICESQEAINLCVTLKIFLHQLINHFYLHKKTFVCRQHTTYAEAKEIYLEIFFMIGWRKKISLAKTSIKAKG